MTTITEKRIKELRKKGHSVHIYPRKGIVVVDGFKYYKLSTK